MTPHIDSEKINIAKTVLMPGDPLRAKFIAQNFLQDYKQVNFTRGMLAYTGKYKGKDITVFASGMGMPSIGIYSYELYKYYDVENIIRIGSCGANVPQLELLDVILSTSSYSEGNFALSLTNEDIHESKSSEELNNIIESTSKELDMKLHIGKTICSEVFDVYMSDASVFMNRMPKDTLSTEMEAFALFHVANTLGKKAACLMTVSDSKFTDKIVTPEDREVSLSNMIKLALESSLKL